MPDTISSLYEVTESTMNYAFLAGRAYWRNNHHGLGDGADIGFVARSIGYREGNEVAFVTGFHVAKKRGY